MEICWCSTKNSTWNISDKGEKQSGSSTVIKLGAFILEYFPNSEEMEELENCAFQEGISDRVKLYQNLY